MRPGYSNIGNPYICMFLFPRGVENINPGNLSGE